MHIAPSWYTSGHGRWYPSKERLYSVLRDSMSSDFRQR